MAVDVDGDRALEGVGGVVDQARPQRGDHPEEHRERRQQGGRCQEARDGAVLGRGAVAVAGTFGRAGPVATINRLAW